MAVQPDKTPAQDDIQVRIGTMRLYLSGLCITDVHCPHYQIGASYDFISAGPLQADQLDVMHACTAGVEGQTVSYPVRWGGG